MREIGGEIIDYNIETARKIIKMMFEENMTYKEIGQELFGTGYSKPYKIVKKFKEELGIPKDIVLSISSYYAFLKPEISMEMIELYEKERISIVAIGERYNMSEPTVRKIFEYYDIGIRGVGYEPRVNQAIFNEIDTELKAYTLGLITTDGHISQDLSSISISLKESDSYILEQINKDLFEGRGHIATTHPERDEPQIKLSWGGKYMSTVLAKYNVVPRKTYNLTKIYKGIRPDLMHHYIRGLYDGDGVTSKSREQVRVGFCGMLFELIEDFQNFLCEELRIARHKLFNTGSCWHVSWHRFEDVEKFYHYIYKDANYFLTRRKEKIENYLFS